MNEEIEYEDLDLFSDEDSYNPMDELKAAAFECLLLHPGSEFDDWQTRLISDYPAEVVDALGENPAEVYSDIADLWETDYWDPKSDIEQKFCDWALAFATEQSVDIYYRLLEAKR